MQSHILYWTQLEQLFNYWQNISKKTKLKKWKKMILEEVFSSKMWERKRKKNCLICICDFCCITKHIKGWLKFWNFIIINFGSIFLGMITIFFYIQHFSYKQKFLLKKTVLQLELFLGFVVPFTSFHKLYKNSWPKPFWWAKLSYIEFSSSNFNLQGSILSIGGVALHSFVELHQT